MGVLRQKRQTVVGLVKQMIRSGGIQMCMRQARPNNSKLHCVLCVSQIPIVSQGQPDTLSTYVTSQCHRLGNQWNA